MFRFATERVTDPASIGASFDSISIDVTPYIRGCVFVLNAGAGTGTNPTLDVKLQESSDDITFTDIPGLAFPQVTDAAAVILNLPFAADRFKKFVRARVVVGGTTPVFLMSTTAVFEERIQN